MIWKGEGEDTNMTLVHVGFVTPNKYNFLPENTCKYSKYRDEIWTIEGGYGENKGMTGRCLSCRYDFSPEIVVGSLTKKHLKTR